MSFDKNSQNIQGNRLFRDVSSKDIKINVSSNNFVEVKEGEIIYQVGDNSDFLYLLIKGQIKIKIYESIGAPPLLKIFDNDFFGEYELLEKTPRKSVAMAVEKSLIYVINEKELKELAKNKTILANLFNLTSAIGTISKKLFYEIEVSSEFNNDEYNSIETPQGRTSSSITSSLKLDDFDDDENDLSWNSSNIGEFKDIFNDEELLDNDEVGDCSLDDDAEINYDKVNLSDTIDQTENSLESFQPDDSELLFSTKETLNKIENGDDSILDQIKKEIKGSAAELIDKHEAEIIDSTQGIDSNPVISEKNKLDDKEQIPTENLPAETTSVELNVAQQEYTEQRSSKEYYEIVKKVIRSINDEIKTPMELIVKYTDLLMRKSLSAEANKVLQKIIDQSNIILDSLQIHADYFNRKINLKTQVFYATNILNDILHLLAGYTEFRKVKLFKKFEADASVLLDKNLFYQAGLHIVKFLCENITGEGSIYVTTNRTKETIIIEFKSNGPKLQDEVLKKISGDFISIENLGLCFAKRIIAEHNGTLIAQNSANSGPEIKVILPIVL